MLHLPKHNYEWVMFFAFWFGGLWVMYYELFFVVAFYHPSWNAIVYFHLTCVAFIAVNIYTDMFMLITTDASIKQVESPGDPPPPSWRYCDKCQKNVPPRSHHCKICDVCILKRDHHCWFAGYCIGFANHRYYLALTFYISVAAIYCNIYNWEYVTDMKGGFAWTTIPSFFAPHVGLCLGYYSAFEFFITVNTSIGFFCLFIFLWLFLMQVSLIWKGQVQYERKKHIFEYSLSPKINLDNVLGTAGFLVFLCPLISSRLAGDGTYFQCREKRKL